MSIVLPNLNTDIVFLKERLVSIQGQSLEAWECIIVDGFSDNGSWEFLCDATTSDSRFKLFQKPRLGIYNAWNEGIKLAQGDYVYIATSDDTMDSDFLKKMVAALEQFPNCDIAHCCLEIINDTGLPVAGPNWDNYLSSQYFGELMHHKHIRQAPHDGILHAFIKTVYQSITQLLIRKKVFDELGGFLEDGGSIADFEWGMRVSLFKDTIHVPEYLATWRCHSKQATQGDIQKNPGTYKKLLEWVALNLTLYRNMSDSNFELRSLSELTKVYKQNERYYTLKRLKERSVVVYRLCRKVFLNASRPSDGVEEAKLYFRSNGLDRLVKVI